MSHFDIPPKLDTATTALFLAIRQILLMSINAWEDWLIVKGVIGFDQKSVTPRRKRAN